jgi:hypothetical protein
VIKIKQYFSNRVYCDCKFRELIELLTDYLVANHFIITSFQQDREYEVISHKISKEIFCGDRKNGIWPEWSILAAPARSIAENSGLILFKVKNMRWAQEKGLLEYKEYPLYLREVFDLCPNYIEIETYYRWNKMQVDVSKNIKNWINNKGICAIERSFQYDLLDVINTAYENDAEKFNVIRNLVKQRFDIDNLHNLDIGNLNPDFILVVPELHKDSIESLRTAEYLYSVRSYIPDCSVGMLGYCKSVEIELRNKLFVPLRKYWASMSRPQMNASASLERLYEYIFNSGNVHLELGTMTYIINHSLKSENNNDDVAISLRKQMEYFPNAIWMRTSLVNDLFKLKKYYRNPAVHEKIFSSSEFERCREIVIGSDSVNGILTNMLGDM